MAGIQPPSSSSRVRPRPPASSSAAPQRPTAAVAPGSVAKPAHPVPLESVVIRPASELQSPCPATKGVANNSKSGDGGEAKSTSVRVCVRFRPLLSGDCADGSAIDNNNDDEHTPRKGGRGFARETAASRHATPRKTPATRKPSGIAAPSTSAKHKNATQQFSQPPEAQPSWQTHPSDKQRITQSSHTTSHTNHHDPDRLADYTFDRVYAPSEATGTLYTESIRNVVGSVVEGFHGSVFAYGQTNSGKTHTMTGTKKEPGVVRLAVRDVFDRISTQTNNGDGGEGAREYLVRVSYLEIYNEQIYDLLAPHQSASPSKFKSSLQHHHLPPSTAVRIFESRTEGVVVRGLREEIVTCPEDVFALLDAGDAKRKVGSTGMNKTSSRSHSVFRLVLESRASRGGGVSSQGVPQLVPSSNSSLNSDTDSVASRSSVSQSLGTAAKGPVRISSLSLVDLAGSESVKNTGSTGVRQKEGQYINKSLLTLGHVVHKLSEMGAREEKLKQQGGGVPMPKEHIPYRDSKLTRLLQPSLGGNAQVCIICNVSPALSSLEESHNTLKFAMRAKKIQQRARITEVADEKTLLRSYREEIEELKRQLKEAHKSAAEAQEQVQLSAGKERRGSSSDEEDTDDAHVLVSAIANLESLILKAGARSTRKATAVDSGSPAAESSLPRALDNALMEAEVELTSKLEMLEVTSPVAGAPNRSSLATPAPTAHPAEDEEDTGLLEELHRIQGMLGSVMKKKRSKGVKSPATAATRTPDRDAEVERLRLQLQEREAASTMREADASFLQGQLAEKEEILKEVSVLLEALEKRQRDLEGENKQLRSDLAEAATLVEEGDSIRKQLEETLAEKDAQLQEKDDVVFVEHPSAPATGPSPPPTPRSLASLSIGKRDKEGLYHI
ncbi:hypothetical protein ACHAXT_005191 [Thalassiosira profunda]